MCVSDALFCPSHCSMDTSRANPTRGASSQHPLSTSCLIRSWATEACRIPEGLLLHQNGPHCGSPPSLLASYESGVYLVIDPRTSITGAFVSMSSEVLSEGNIPHLWCIFIRLQTARSCFRGMHLLP